MKHKPTIALIAASLIASSAGAAIAELPVLSNVAGQTVSAGKFESGNGTFLLNGAPFVVKAAELHYPRIPKPYWDQRIQLCKALGMN
ncbi:MAG: beta-galactosidase, partial [Muribaculaceae bacterium]|nr:beta-galactosidase [Muribaculaceae bacterium]